MTISASPPGTGCAVRPAIAVDVPHQAAPRQIDLLIVGVGRAGTTLLANLLTSPPRSLVLIEPGITRGGVDAPLREQFNRAGLTLPDDAFDASRQPDSLQRFLRLLPAMERFEKWGVKEVNPAGLDALMHTFRPLRHLLAVRDLRFVAVSGLRKLHTARRADQNELWLLDRLAAGAQTVLRLAHSLPADAARVVRYEDLVASDTERQDIARWLDWPMDGDPTRCLDLFGRESEVAKHDGRVTDRSLQSGESDWSIDERVFARSLIDRVPGFQERFGYAHARALRAAG
ncbi:MAG: sulfotransferase [Phycisphaeraceae bacterium]|nr:sulfotransferase [Phycisphaeraceae bacterium]